jgi:trehalose/maltose transport system substrate-binding protein
VAKGKVFLSGLLLLAAAITEAATVSISCGAVGIELQTCREGAEAWARRTGNAVRIISTPNSSTDRLALYQQLLAARSADIDVFQIDVIWPGILHRHFMDLGPLVAPERLANQFANAVDAGRVQGRLVSLPWFIDAGLLYYRKDLLDKYGHGVPQTWQELTDVALDVQTRERAAGHRFFWGFVWQGRAYEGLTCNALEWVHSQGGGSIIDRQGRVTIDNPQAVAALDLAASWVDRITPPGVLNYDEEQTRGAFQSGRALFMRNWPYAWPLVNGTESPVSGKVAIAPLPRGEGGVHTGTLGGWHLAVSRYTRVQAEAVDLVRYLTHREEQKRRAVRAGYYPTWKSLYEDAEVLEANPAVQTLYPVLLRAVARPSDVTDRHYNQVSSAFWTAVHATLAGRGDAQTNLSRLAPRLERLMQRAR